MNLSFENSIKLEEFNINDGIKNPKEKAFVLDKVQRTPNQVFVTKGLDKTDTIDFVTPHFRVALEFNINHPL